MPADLVAAFLASGKHIAPDAVFEAHIGATKCEDSACPICQVYCEVCGLSYGFEDQCPFH